MDARLLDILVCPLCKGPLADGERGRRQGAGVPRRSPGVPIRDGIPVMLEEEARLLEATDPLLER